MEIFPLSHVPPNQAGRGKFVHMFISRARRNHLGSSIDPGPMATSSALSVEPFPLRVRLMIKWRVGRRPDPPAVQKLRRRRSTSPASSGVLLFWGTWVAPNRRSPERRRASSGALGTPLLRVNEISSSGELGAPPLPLAGEGWGGGILARILRLQAGEGTPASIACDPRDSADRYLRAWVCTLSVTGVPARTASSERSSAGMSCLGPSTFSPRPPQVSTTFS